MQTDRILVLMTNLPMKVEFIETPEKVAELLPKLHETAGTGLIEIQDTMIVKSSETSKQAAHRADTPPSKRQGKAKLVRSLIESMRSNDIAGVTVYQGILGYGANRRIHKDRAQGLVVFSDVDVIKYTCNYQEAERRKGERS